jgi:hypothetical protein
MPVVLGWPLPAFATTFTDTTTTEFGSGPIFFRGENTAVLGGCEADNCLTFHSRLHPEYPTTARIY